MVEVQFKDVAIGAVFFDSFSGEDFIKVSETEGKFYDSSRCFGDPDELDEFSPDEIVELHTD